MDVVICTGKLTLVNRIDCSGLVPKVQFFFQLQLSEPITAKQVYYGLKVPWDHDNCTDL